MQTVNPPSNLPTLTTIKWMTNWAGIPNSVEPTNLTKLQKIPFTSPSKTIFVEEIFQVIVGKY
jgi:hypothetical protein